MAVKSSGSLSITTDIVGEFGGDTPHAISEYYGGAGLVPAGANPGVPTSGEISFSDMYGTVAATVLTISSNTSNYNIATAAVAAGGDLNTPVILTVNSGVTVSSSSSSNPAMTTGQGWGAGTTINITNNGSIVGASGSNATGSTASGGNGGRGFRPGTPATNGSSGSNASSSSVPSSCNGGDAFRHDQTGSNLSVIFDTAGTRTGGSAGQATFPGGGGGGGGGMGDGNCGSDEDYCSGNGGGGGAAYGSGGQGGQGSIVGTPGSPGGATTGGNGGGYAGRGGNSGQAGQASGSRPNGFGNETSGGGAGSNATGNGTAGSALAGNTAQIS